jgi:hypothetical protein
MEDKGGLVFRIVEDMSSGELLAAMDSNMVAFWSAYGRAPGSMLYATSNMVWFYIAEHLDR